MRQSFLGIVVAAACVGTPGASFAVGLFLSHSYGEFVDRGTISAEILASDSSRIDCGAGVLQERVGNRITLTARKAPGAATIGDCTRVGAMIGALAVGNYEVAARLVAADGTSVEEESRPLAVLPIEGRCNRDPALSPSIVAILESPAQFLDRLANDPAYAAQLGHPAVRKAPYGDEFHFDYPPLVDIPPAMDRLATSNDVTSMWRNGRVCLATPPPDAIARIVEFHHSVLDHYFYTGNTGEIADIEAGKVGPGWTRTGKFFRAVSDPGCPFMNGQSVVYRFNGIPGIGPNSHFFTRDRAECLSVDRSGKWAFEGLPFWASEPSINGSCEALTSAGEPRVPLYRVWRPFGESNHRFTTERGVVNDMVGEGWIDEGAAMCVLPSS